MTRITPEDGIAIVTGAGSGLGRALARQLCDAGFTVVGTGRRAEALEETGAACADRFQPMPMDVSDFAAVERGFAESIARHGALALLVNNAAVYPKRDVFDETPELFWQSMAINLGGVYACSGAARRGAHPERLQLCRHRAPARLRRLFRVQGGPKGADACPDRGSL